MSQILAVKVTSATTLTLLNGNQLYTAIRKQAVPKVTLNTLGPIGDEVGDKTHHGGIDKAVFFNGQKTLEKLTALLGLEYDYLQDSRFG